MLACVASSPVCRNHSVEEVFLPPALEGEVGAPVVSSGEQSLVACCLHPWCVPVLSVTHNGDRAP